MTGSGRDPWTPLSHFLNPLLHRVYVVYMMYKYMYVCMSWTTPIAYSYDVIHFSREKLSQYLQKWNGWVKIMFCAEIIAFGV